MDKNKFFLNAVVVMVFIIAGMRLWQEFKLVVPNEKLATETSAELLAEAKKSYPATLTPVTAFQVMQKLEKPTTPATLLYIYTSWCGVCARQTPVLQDIAKDYPAKNLRIISVSLDEDMEALAEHLKEKPLGERFENYVLLREDKKKLMQGLRYYGINFRSSYPFLVVLDSYGRQAIQGNAGYLNYGEINDALLKAFGTALKTP